MKDDRTVRVEISYKTIIFAVSLLIGLWFLVQIREIIILIFISLILLSALLGPVEYLTQRRVPRALSVLIVYVILIALISFAIGIIFPPLISQTTEFVTKLPQITGTINDFLIFNKIPVENVSSVVASQARAIGGNLIAISSAILSSIFLIVTFLVFTFYLLLEWKSVVRLIASPFSGRQEKKVKDVIAKVEGGLGKWVRGQLTLSIIVGVITYIGLRVLGIPYALPLALVTGILEIIPIIGPIIAAVPAILVGLTISPVVGLGVAALFLVVQQLENHLIVPMVMSRAVGLQPTVVIIALLIGAKLAGVGGAFLAIPLLVAGRIIFKEFLVEDRKLEEELQEV
ncbi:MAG: AI-2E family transporter [Candidatus Curtissbacteria bacterium]|nr:AI-2E family transporter [Candidatus Curtissbacteria bacterium]